MADGDVLTIVTGHQAFAAPEAGGAGLPSNWEVDPEFENITVTSAADVTDYEYMLILRAMDGVTPVPMVELTTAGDADWYFYDSGTGLRFHDRTNGPSTILSVGMDNVYVRSQANVDMLVLYRLENQIQMPNLPTVDPGFAGYLYTDGVPSAGVPKPLMVSGG